MSIHSSLSLIKPPTLSNTIPFPLNPIPSNFSIIFPRYLLDGGRMVELVVITNAIKCTQNDDTNDLNHAIPCHSGGSLAIALLIYAHDALVSLTINHKPLFFHGWA